MIKVIAFYHNGVLSFLPVDQKVQNKINEAISLTIETNKTKVSLPTNGLITFTDNKEINELFVEHFTNVQELMCRDGHPVDIEVHATVYQIYCGIDNLDLSEFNVGIK